MTDTIPVQYIIKGVPFVSWREAARFEYEDKDISNPSTKACALMLVGFWGPDVLSSGTAQPYPPQLGDLTEESADLICLKSCLAMGVPVLLPTLALTPYAHPVGAWPDMTGFQFPEGALKTS